MFSLSTGNDAAASLSEQARAALANLPPNLGQAASALSEFAAGFKRSEGANSGEEGSHQEDGAGPSGTQEADAPKSIEGDGTEEQEQQRQDGEGQEEHDPDATAAAIAAMDDLARHQMDETNQSMDDAGDVTGASAASRKIKTGKTEETERQRKDNHKEVERKRRANINSAITELQVIVPKCDGKGVNKGDIIINAAQYIRDLKSNEASNISKWTLEKLLMDQAMNDLRAQLDGALDEISRLREYFGSAAQAVPRAPSPVGQHGDDHHHQQHQHHLDEAHQPEDPDALQPEIDPGLEAAAATEGETENDGDGALHNVAAAAAAAARAAAVKSDGSDDQAQTSVLPDDVAAVRAAAVAAAVNSQVAQQGAADVDLPVGSTDGADGEGNYAPLDEYTNGGGVADEAKSAPPLKRPSSTSSASATSANANAAKKQRL